MRIGIVLLGGVLETVGLRGLLAHGEDFLDTALRVRPRQVALSQHEAHHVVELGLRVHYQVLKPDKQRGHTAELGIVHHGLHPAVYVRAAVLDPPVEVVGVQLLVVERALYSVVVHGNQVQPGEIRIERVPHNHDILVGVEDGRLRHNPGRVALNHPACVIDDVFALHSLHLQGHVDVKRIVSTSGDTREHLDVAAQESVTRAWERAERDLVAGVGFAIEEPEMAIEYPLGFLPELFIATLKQFSQLAKVDYVGVWTSNDVLVLVQEVARVQSRELLAELLESLALLSAIRSRH